MKSGLSESCHVGNHFECYCRYMHTDQFNSKNDYTSLLRVGRFLSGRHTAERLEVLTIRFFHVIIDVVYGTISLRHSQGTRTWDA